MNLTLTLLTLKYSCIRFANIWSVCMTQLLVNLGIHWPDRPVWPDGQRFQWAKQDDVGQTGGQWLAPPDKLQQQTNFNINKYSSTFLLFCFFAFFILHFLCFYVFNVFYIFFVFFSFFTFLYFWTFLFLLLYFCILYFCTLSFGSDYPYKLPCKIWSL